MAEDVVEGEEEEKIDLQQRARRSSGSWSSIRTIQKKRKESLDKAIVDIVMKPVMAKIELKQKAEIETKNKARSKKNKDYCIPPEMLLSKRWIIG